MNDKIKKITSKFNPKRYILGLSDNRLEKNQIYFLIGSMLILPLLPFLLSFNSAIHVLKTTLAPLDKIAGPERVSIIFEIITGVISGSLFLLLANIAIIVFFSWIIKKILGLFKRKISIFKLLNISVYVVIASIVFNALTYTIFLLILYFYPTLNNISSEYQSNIFLIQKTTINLVLLVLYIYAISLSITANKKQSEK